jgi:hypothetical protein
MITDSGIDIGWAGPYSWPGYESECGLPPIPEKPGVYLQTVEYQDGYLIYCAGITRRTVPTRFQEHTRKYLSGDYNVLDIQSMRQGIRKEIWRGWGWSPEKRAEFDRREVEILDAVRRQLAGFRVFVADVGCESRILERIEGSVMHHLYRQPQPFCDIPDKGMMLAPRWPNEVPLVGTNSCAVLLHCLPQYLEI